MVLLCKFKRPLESLYRLVKVKMMATIRRRKFGSISLDLRSKGGFCHQEFFKI